MKLSFNKEIGKYELIQDDKIIGTSKSKKYLENKMAKILNNSKPQNKNDSENIIKKYCEKIKVKIQNAINILRLEDKKITHYSIAKVGEVSYITVKKSISEDKIISLNKEY